MKSRSDGLPFSRLTRRTATVTISAPPAWWQARMTSCDGYLPVPRINREENESPPTVQPSAGFGEAEASVVISVRGWPSHFGDGEVHPAILGAAGLGLV